MSAESQKIADDMFLHIGVQIEDLIQRECDKLVGMCSVAEIVGIQCKLAVSLAFSAIGHIAANAEDAAAANRLVDDYCARIPAWIARGRDRAATIGFAAREGVPTEPLTSISFTN